MKSIAEATNVGSNSGPVLVGGKKYKMIETHTIFGCDIDIPPSTPSQLIATQCRSLFIKCHGVEGMLYRKGKHLLVSDGDSSIVIKADEFFGVCLFSGLE